MIPVVCKSDKYLHLAPTAEGCGASKFTLCLEPWKDHAAKLVDPASEWCPLCEQKWKERLERGAQQ